MQILHVENPPREECGHPSHELEPPRELVEPKSEKRLVAPLREAARTRDALEILVRATMCSYTARDPRLAGLARSMADMAATGSHAAVELATLKLGPSDLATLAAARTGVRRSDDEMLTRHAASVLERAQLVARYLNQDAIGRARLASARPELAGWIGVSGEDDPPHRPVNVPTAEHVERSIVVRMRDHTLRVRYAIAGAIDGRAPIVLFLHGHSSKLEENERLAAALGAARDERGAPKFCVLMPDLPNAGYTSRIDHEAVAPLDSPGTPLLAFHEEFVEAFVEAITGELGVEKRLACLAGGSLGGNLVLRIAEQQPAWIDRFAAWSPASVWSALTGDLIKGLGPRRARINMSEDESAVSRRAYFKEVFATPICLTGRTQPEMWYRDGMLCRPRHINRVIWDRREIYGPEYRRWHWRLAYEQLVFSHITPLGAGAPFHRIRGPLLLLAGDRDDFMWTHIYSRTRDLARKLGANGVRGACLLLKNTGHSIHDERPSLLAAAIERFVDRHA